MSNGKGTIRSVTCIHEFFHVYVFGKGTLMSNRKGFIRSDTCTNESCHVYVFGKGTLMSNRKGFIRSDTHVVMCVGETERERESACVGEGEYERVYVCMCVCKTGRATHFCAYRFRKGTLSVHQIHL